MEDKVRVEFEIEAERHFELMREAERLGLPPEELARRAVAAWLFEMVDDGMLQQVAEA